MKLINGFVLSALCLFLASCGAAPSQKGGVNRGLEDYVRQARALSREDRQNQGSLWVDSSRLGDGYRDFRARTLGDIVTIQVLESTNAVSQATTDTAKDSNAKAEIPGLFGAEKRISELANPLDTSRSSQFKGDASTTRKSVLQTDITARVTDVFPNGNMLVEGSREILINGERQLVTVRGIVRPEDVTPQNIVLSTSVAELEVEVQGKGIVTRAQKPGVLYKILSGFWPF